ncbi:E3 binding domain-containing protein, partial [Lysobacter sp. A03]|uniref:E3 binding domain-containing protein n=1 Tax=Lysobacter sp. A03 TaxID=1199154 RepID=UPI0005C79564
APGHGHGPPPPGKSEGSEDPASDDKVVASDDGGAISDEGETPPEGESRPDSGTVVGAMQSSDAVRSEQASTVGGVKAMPAVRALARKLKVDLARVTATGTDGVVTMADVKQAAADGSAAVGAAPARPAPAAAPAPG